MSRAVCRWVVRAQKWMLEMENWSVGTPKLKCPVENCTWTIEAPTEFEARIKLIVT